MSPEINSREKEIIQRLDKFKPVDPQAETAGTKELPTIIASLNKEGWDGGNAVLSIRKGGSDDKKYHPEPEQENSGVVADLGKYLEVNRADLLVPAHDLILAMRKGGVSAPQPHEYWIKTGGDPFRISDGEHAIIYIDEDVNMRYVKINLDSIGVFCNRSNPKVTLGSELAKLGFHITRRDGKNMDFMIGFVKDAIESGAESLRR